MLIADFYKYVLPSAPGCPDELLRQEIVGAVQKLCNRAHVWRELQDPVPLEHLTAEYEPDYPLGARVVNVECVWVGNREIRNLTFGELNNRLPDWRTSQGSEPAYFTGSNDWGVIRFIPMPYNPTSSYQLRAEFEPKIDATSLPDFILQRYQAEIVMGAKSALMLMDGVTWSNPSKGEYWRQQFENALCNAAIKMIHERNSGSVRVRSIAFK